MANLNGKVAIVTGASSGIGAALAKAFSREGARVALAARRLRQLEEVAQTCSGEVLVMAADIVKETVRRRIVQ